MQSCTACLLGVRVYILLAGHKKRTRDYTSFPEDRLTSLAFVSDLPSIKFSNVSSCPVKLLMLMKCRLNQFHWLVSGPFSTIIFPVLNVASLHTWFVCTFWSLLIVVCWLPMFWHLRFLMALTWKSLHLNSHYFLRYTSLSSLQHHIWNMATTVLFVSQTRASEDPVVCFYPIQLLCFL